MGKQMDCCTQGQADRLAGGRASRPASRLGLGVLAGAILVALLPTTANAAYPDRPVKILVPFAPGGASDIAARIISVPLTQALGQTVFIENRAGATGNVGITSVAKAEPDGYTLLVASSVFVVNPTLSKQAGYDPVRDFAPITNLGASPNVIITRPDSGIRTLADMIARARANPNELNFASSGVGSITQLSIEVLKIRANIRMVHVPYSGAGPAVQAVLSGTTQIGGVNIAAAFENIKSGSLRALAQTGRERWSDLPDVPTLGQAGITNADSETFQALFAPTATPKPIVDLLEKEMVAILSRPDVRDRLQKAGLGTVPYGSEALRTRVIEDVAMWRDVITQTGLRVD
jgi:tripartite-type tricarboxylate transporter receptor subunit TctC